MDAAESTIQHIKTTGSVVHTTYLGPQLKAKSALIICSQYLTPLLESLAIFLDRDFDAAQFATNVLETDNATHAIQQKKLEDNGSGVEQCLSSLSETLHSVNDNIKQIVYANHHKLLEGAMHVSKLRESMHLISTSLTRSVMLIHACSKAKMNFWSFVYNGAGLSPP